MDPKELERLRREKEAAAKPAVAAFFAFCTIIDAFAHTGTYVIDTFKGHVPASDMYQTSMLPMGARPIGGYAPKSRVLVMFDAAYDNAVIIGGVPRALADKRLVIPNSITMRPRVGIAEDPMHFSNFVNSKSFLGNFSAGRTADSLPGDWGYINDMGLSFFLGRMMASMKASDGAKIEAFWGDDLLRVVGYNLETFTAGMEKTQLNDEGEYDEVKRTTPYPWEAMGSGKKEGKIARNADGQLAPGSEYASWEPSEDKQLIIPRVSTFSGYLGDLSREIISAPPDDLELEKLDNTQTKHRGLAEVIKSSDGLLAFRSAKALVFEKYCLIPVPKQMVAPEDPLGDSIASGFKPAGTDVDVPEFKWDDTQQSGARQAQLFDYLAYTFNKYTNAGLWKHEQDWYYPNEKDLDKPLSGSLYDKSFTELQNKFLLDLPKVGELKIDHRKGREAIKYYQSRSIIAQLDDGSIVIEDGYGSSIVMKGGSVFLSAPGDIWQLPGRSAVTWAPFDAIVRAGNSVDISAAKHDVRIKAENNLHILGGNSENTGGVLIESKSQGRSTASDYQRNGQQNSSKGILLLCPDGACDIISKDIYIGLGQISTGSGTLTLDAGESGRVFVTGSNFLSRMNLGFTLQVADEGGDTLNEFAVTPGGMVAAGQLQLGGSLVLAPTEKSKTADLIVGGNVICYGIGAFNDGVVANGGYGSFRAPGPAGKIDKEIPFTPAAKKLGDQITNLVERLGKPIERLTSDIRDNAETAPGNAQYQKALGFSFRSSNTDMKLNEDSFVIFESRWQQMMRLGVGGSGQTWDEPVVKAPNGEETLPHPGKDGWQSWSALGQDNLKNFDVSAGNSNNRDALAAEGETSSKTQLKSGYLITVKPD